MRTLPMLFLALAGCPSPSTPDAPDDPPEADTDAPTDGAAVETGASADGAPADDAPDTDAPALQPLPEAAAVDAPPIHLVGYGISLRLNPPFQAMRMPNVVEGAPETGTIVSWWDVSAPLAGVRGDAGLHNLQIAAKVPSEAAPPEKSTFTSAKGNTFVAWQAGDGTQVRLPYGYATLGGFGPIEAGPRTDGWKVKAGDALLDWPPDTMLHSADPASGRPVSFEEVPRRPWGPWPEPPTAPTGVPEDSAQEPAAP